MIGYAEGYNLIFKVMRQQFGEEWYSSVKPIQWNIWRRHIKTQLFDHDIIASEAIAVIPDMDKRQWPAGTGFFSRVRDLVLLGRRQKEQVVKIEKGPEKLGDLLRSYPQTSQLDSITKWV